MGYNYCLVITKKEVVGLVLEVLKKEKLSAELITKSDGSELVINENSLISYFGRSFPDLEEILFNYTALGFAFVESFAFLLFFVAGIVIFL